MLGGITVILMSYSLVTNVQDPIFVFVFHTILI